MTSPAGPPLAFAQTIRRTPAQVLGAFSPIVKPDGEAQSRVVRP